METYKDQADHKLEEKMAELMAIREKLYRAKDNAMQSWLDSKPLIDELEKLQAALASAKNRTSMSNIVISELESQLKAAEIDIRTRTEEEAKAKEMIDDVSRILDQMYKESEQMKLDADEERRARSKLKQVLRMRRQRLRTLQQTLRAIRIESEAFEASMKEALGLINISETDDAGVVIGQGEFYDLTKRAKEEKALAEWRISVSVDQKLAAAESRNFALSRLKEIRRKREKAEVGNEEIEGEQVEEEVKNGNGLPKVREEEEASAKSNRRKPRRRMRRAARKSKKKKLSCFSRIRSFLVWKFAGLLR